MTFRAALKEFLQWVLAELNTPGEVHLTFEPDYREGDMATRYKVRATLSATRPEDKTESREASVKLNDGTPEVTTLPPSAVQHDFWGMENDVVFFSLVDIDQAGNRSPPRTATTTIRDTIAPAQPGEIQMETVAQEEVPDGGRAKSKK